MKTAVCIFDNRYLGSVPDLMSFKLNKIYEHLNVLSTKLTPQKDSYYFAVDSTSDWCNSSLQKYSIVSNRTNTIVVFETEEDATLFTLKFGQYFCHITEGW